MRKAREWKHVFCLEGLWEDDLKKESTIEPALELLSKHYHKLKFIHKDCATTPELEYYLSKWTTKKYDDYPILYLAFHGKTAAIQLSDGDYSIDQLSKVISGKCANRIIIFDSCSTLDASETKIHRFLKDTGALAVCGYENDVYWVESVVHNILIIEAIQDNEYSLRGINAIKERIKEISRQFKGLKFKIVTRKDLQ